jgi:hypothetical protein
MAETWVFLCIQMWTDDGLVAYLGWLHSAQTLVAYLEWLHSAQTHEDGTLDRKGF